ncbi:MAG: N-acetyl-gamma-glutamyl-phosphate reductase [Verrucomicrobiota bacterium]
MHETRTAVAVVGASGYTGAELLRLLIMHPRADLVAVTSRTEAGRGLTSVFPRFAGSPVAEELIFVEPDAEAIAASGAKFAFLALPHGVASQYARDLLARGVRVIDLSADFRLRSAQTYEEFYGEKHPAPELLEEAVYGLPEIRADQIVGADLVASPGCYPTSILLPLLPCLKAGLIDKQSICVSSLSGASGAGKKTDPSLLFVEVNESLRAYGAPKHRHLSEIEQELSIAAEETIRVSFVPHLMPVNAGIATTIFADLSIPIDQAREKLSSVFAAAYGDAFFVRLLGEGRFADSKQVVRTNFVDIGWVIDERTGRLILSSAEDNLGKGAGSQAIQSFNLMNGWEEKTGLMHF